MRGRRAGVLAAAALLALLGGCGARPQETPRIRVGIDAPQIVGALLAFPEASAPVRFVPSPPTASDPFVISSSGTLRQWLGRGDQIIGSGCARQPESLLWHRDETFGWSDVSAMPLYSAPGADAVPLSLALARYKGLVPDLRPPLPAVGGVRAFLREPEAFLLAPEPLASALVANGQALLAQSLADELGPFPGCFVLVRGSILRHDPLVAVELLRQIDLGIFELKTGRLPELALQARPAFPTTTYRGLERALSVARANGTWPESAYISASTLQAEFSELGQTLPSGSLLDRYARQAVEHPFLP